jgi:hypothetical protein
MSWRWTGGAEDPGESLVEIDLRAEKRAPFWAC